MIENQSASIDAYLKVLESAKEKRDVQKRFGFCIFIQVHKILSQFVLIVLIIMYHYLQ